MCFSLLSGCQKAQPLPFATSSRPASFRVIAITLWGETAIEAEYGLSVRKAGPNQRFVSTMYTSGVLNSGDEQILFDSRVRTPEDAWPMLMQHAISAAPARFAFNDLGAPESMTNYDFWREQALLNLAGLQLPGSPDFSQSPMLSQGGSLHDLRSIFPGKPSSSGLIRSLTIAGLQVMVTEICNETQVGTNSVWECSGELDSIGGSNSRVFGIATRSRLEFGSLGMLRMEAEFVGTSVALNPSTGELVDQPIAGKRLVERL
jgi:hypothetical protein